MTVLTPTSLSPAADLFDRLIQETPKLELADLGDMSTRAQDKLMSFTTNLNPAVQHAIAAICAHREEATSAKEKFEKKFIRRSLFDINFAGKETGRVFAAEQSAGLGKQGTNETQKDQRPQKRESESFAETVHPGKTKKVQSSALKDSMTGPDFVNFKEYAKVLSQVAFKIEEHPVVVGVYAGWGSGKSFVMNKASTYIKYFNILQELARTSTGDLEKPDWKTFIAAKDDKNVNENNAAARNNTACKTAQQLHEWMKADDEAGIDAIWKEMMGKRTDHGFSYCTALKRFGRTIPLLVLWVLFALCEKLLGCCGAFQWCCSSTKPSEPDWPKQMKKIKKKLDKQDPRRKAKRDDAKLDDQKEPLLATSDSGAAGEHADDKSPTDDDKSPTVQYDYEVIWFNAWLFNGTDNLWAALVLKLIQGVEDHYGPEFKYAKREAELWKLVTSVLFALAVGSLIALLAFYPDWFSSEVSLDDWLAVPAAIASVISFLSVAKLTLQNIRIPGSLSEGLARDVQTESMESKLGFMNQVKEKLAHVGDLLQRPREVELALDHYLPSWFPDAGKKAILKKMKATVVTRNGKPRLPCRFIVFVDDLDRCEPAKCVEVLQAINLMCEDLPFIVFLAMDVRVVVSSIETANDKFYSKSGISGFNYLDKIVQLPFTLPALCSVEKKGMLRGFLTGKTKKMRDYFTMKAFDQVIPTTGRAPGGAAFLLGKLLYNQQRRDDEGRGLVAVDADTGQVDEALTALFPAHIGRLGPYEMIHVSKGNTVYISRYSNPYSATTENPSDSCVEAYELDEATKMYARKHRYGVNICPAGITTTETHLYVTNINENSIIKFAVGDPQNQTTLDTRSCGQLTKPMGIDVVDSSRLIVADYGNDRVVIMGTNGALKRVIDLGHGVVDGLRSPYDVCHDAEGNILIYDTINRRVVVCDKNGEFKCDIGKGKDSHGFAPAEDNTGNVQYSCISSCPETGRLAVVDDINSRIFLLNATLV